MTKQEWEAKFGGGRKIEQLESQLQEKEMKVLELERKNYAKDERINMFKSYRDDFYEMEEEILDLKKENAELKEVAWKAYLYGMANCEVDEYRYDLKETPLPPKWFVDMFLKENQSE